MGKIKTAAEGLSALSTKLSGDPLKPERARLLRDFIENNLLAAPESLHNWLVGGVPLTDGILKSASQAASKRKRFFDASDSASVKSVYDYYALYQVQLATLLTNYMHAKPEAWSGQDIQTQVAKIEANIDQQEKLLKPTVPDGAVVDMNTNKMWTQNYSPNNLPASEFFRRVKPQGVGPLKTEWPQGTHGPRGIQGLPFGNWTLPSQAEIETLIQGRGGKAGVVWLKEEAGMSQNQASGGGGWAFMSKPTGWKAHIQGTRSLADDSLEIFRYDLWRGIVVSKEIRWCGDANARCVEELRGKLGEIKGATMYVRPLGNDERYWWR